MEKVWSHLGRGIFISDWNIIWVRQFDTKLPLSQQNKVLWHLLAKIKVWLQVWTPVGARSMLTCKIFIIAQLMLAKNESNAVKFADPFWKFISLLKLWLLYIQKPSAWRPVYKCFSWPYLVLLHKLYGVITFDTFWRSWFIPTVANCCFITLSLFGSLGREALS